MVLTHDLADYKRTYNMPGNPNRTYKNNLEYYIFKVKHQKVIGSARDHDLENYNLHYNMPGNPQSYNIIVEYYIFKVKHNID